MVKLHKKIVSVLQPQLADFQDALEDLPGGRVTGVVVSSTFNAMSFQSRQKKLSAILNKKLTVDELLSLGPIAALTPAEASVKAS